MWTSPIKRRGNPRSPVCVPIRAGRLARKDNGEHPSTRQLHSLNVLDKTDTNEENRTHRFVSRSSVPINVGIIIQILTHTRAPRQANAARAPIDPLQQQKATTPAYAGAVAPDSYPRRCWGHERVRRRVSARTSLRRATNPPVPSANTRSVTHVAPTDRDHFLHRSDKCP